jgi:hypothetical protein
MDESMALENGDDVKNLMDALDLLKKQIEFVEAMLDDRNQPGWSKNNPAIVAALTQTLAINYLANSVCLGKHTKLGDLIAAVADVARSIPPSCGS